MAEIGLSPQTITRDGLNPTYHTDDSSPALSTGDFDGAGDQFMVDDDKAFLHVMNGSANVISVTIQTPKTVDGLAIADRVVSLPAGADRFIGPFPRETYGRPWKFALSAVADVEVAILKI